MYWTTLNYWDEKFDLLVGKINVKNYLKETCLLLLETAFFRSAQTYSFRIFLCTTLSLQWEPEIIAVALMYLAGKLSKFEVVDWNGRLPKHLRWWDMFVEDVTMDLLEDICHQVLDLYSQANNTKPPDSPPLTPSNEPCRDRAITAPSTESISTTPNVTPGKATKVEAVAVSANGCLTTDTTDAIKPMDVPTHFQTYPTNFAHSNINYPPAFPPANVSVPPPSVNTMNHIVPPMHHMGSSGAIRPAPPTSTTTPTPFQPYPYPTNASYFPPNNPVPPAPTPRTYYPPQP